MCAGLFLATGLLTGCSYIWLKDSYDVLVRQSAPQTLTVTNTGPSALTVGSGGATRAIAPGGVLTVRFQVDSIGTLKKPNGTPYWTVLPDRYREQFVELDRETLVDASGDPLKLTFMNGNRPEFVTFSLNLCPGPGWPTGGSATTTYGLAVPDPQPVIPHAICPR